MPEVGVLPNSVQTVPEAVAWWAERTPDAPVMLELDHPPLTYQELHCRITRAGASLRATGITSRDRVALVLGDDTDSVVALLAVMSVACAAPFNPASPAAALLRDLRRLGAKALVAGPTESASARAVAGELGLPVISLQSSSESPEVGSSEPDLARAMPRPEPDDVMLIAHTSGTTALPKRVPITHRMQLAAARGRNRQRSIGPADRCLNLAPQFTVMFLTNFVTMLVAGGSTIRVPRPDPLVCLRANAELQPTWILAAPPLYSAMLQQLPMQRSLFANPRLRLVNWGGSGADPTLIERLEEAFAVPADSHYGLSEASAIATPTAPGSAKPGSVGVAAAAEIRIVAETGERVGAGYVGEIVVRGPTVFAGYLDDPVATADALTDGGWFRTGDLGYLDADGHLFLTGRATDQINRGGVKIAPTEVEQALSSHPAVAEAAVFGTPDAVQGEDAVVAVVLQPGTHATARQLRAWMLDRLTPHKVPRRIWFVSEIPRTESGKVRRGMLADRYREQHVG